MQTTITFDPLIEWPLIVLVAGVALMSVGIALWRGLSGWWLRAMALSVMILALAGPQLKREEREGLGNVGFVVVDRSESTGMEDRAAQIDAAVERLRADAEALGGQGRAIDLRLIDVAPDDSGRNRGTRLMSALDEAASRVSPDRIAGAVLVTDGQVHDSERVDSFPAPVHVLIAGEQGGFDLRLEMTNSPAFGIVGESVTYKLRASALGDAPSRLGAAVAARVSIDGAEPRPLRLNLGVETELEVRIDHGGPTVVDVQIPVLEAELTDRNNRIISTVNGVRDRLRVLLVSGEPHPGGRTWRDLLKSDPTVELIHFTILRPPSKQDGTPVSELSLIAFPTRELFLEKIQNFDLIVFDRYRWRGVLATAYLANIANYVREGGAVLVASGPAFSGPQSLARTPLGEILPAEPTMEVFERPFLPRVSEIGERHPVTAGLEQSAGLSGGEPNWGRWLRQVDIAQRSGHAVMVGVDNRPLLILDRVEKGRVALLGSDHAWLWSRGYEGGGPQADLLRRLAHWLMREPELEEEALFARVEGRRIIVERRSLAETPRETVNATAPGGQSLELSLRSTAPGRWQSVIESAEEGLWRFADGEAEAVAAVGPPSPREYENPLASAELLSPLAGATGGDVRWLSEDGTPELRVVEAGRRAHGRSWIAMAEREAYRVTGVRLTELLPVWLAALMTGLLFLAAWRREGR